MYCGRARTHITIESIFCYLAAAFIFNLAPSMIEISKIQVYHCKVEILGAFRDIRNCKWW